MFSRNLSKFLFLILAFSLCTASCKYFEGFGGQNKKPDVSIGELESSVPFSNKEPEVYQAEIVTVSYEADEKTERKIFVAKNKENVLAVYDKGTPHETHYLRTDNQTFSIYLAKKIFTEINGATGAPSMQAETLNDYLTSNWLNDKTSAAYENLGTENSLLKYSAKLDNSEGVSEILVYVDEKLNMPIKIEALSVLDGQKTLLYSSEIKDLKLQTEEKYFEIPAEFKKVSSNEFHEIIWQDRQ